MAHTPFATIAAFLLLALPASAIVPVGPLESGDAVRFSEPMPIEPQLAGDLSFAVPPGATWVTFEIRLDEPGMDAELHASLNKQPTFDADSGTVASQHGSISAGATLERIFINDATAPPLQSGVYRLAVFIPAAAEAVSGSITATAALTGGSSTVLRSNFDDGSLDGWTRNFPASPIPGATNGDFGGGVDVTPLGELQLTDADGPSRDFAVAPPKFLGNFADFGEARLEFDYTHATGRQDVVAPVEVRLLGADSAYRWRGPVPGEEPIRIVVPLDGTDFVRELGGAEFNQVLADVRRIEILADHSPGPEINLIDNVLLVGEPPDAPPGNPGAAAVSDFRFGLDGWTHNYPPVAIPFAAIGTPDAQPTLGNPDSQPDRFLLFDDPAGLLEDFAVAPARFRGDLTQLDAPFLRFDYQRFAGANPATGIRVQILGAGSLFRWTGPRPKTEWVTYSVPLNAQNWVHVDGTAPFDMALAAVDRLEVLMDLAPGAEQNGLDNFSLLEGYQPPQGRRLTASETDIRLSLAADDQALTLEPIQITSTGTDADWTAAVTPVSPTWLAINAAQGRTPTELTITLDPTAVALGVYNATLEIRPREFGVPGVTITIELTVTEALRRPTISAGGISHAAAAGLTISPGVIASVFGENLSDVTLSTAFEPGTQRLPTRANGVEVQVFDEAGNFIASAPLLFLSPTQLNLQIPYETLGRTAIQLRAFRDSVQSSPGPTAIVPAAPGIFVYDGNRAVALNADNTLNGPENPTTGVLQVFFTGAGVTSPAATTGEAATADPLRLIEGVSARVGENDVTVLGAAMVPGFVGLAQANIGQPAFLNNAPVDQPLVIRVTDRPSNRTVVSIGTASNN